MIRLSTIETDFLKEIANIGIGHAATSLAKMVNAKVDISLPTMQVISVDNLIGIKVTETAAITTGISGDLKGLLAIIFSAKTSYWLIDKMYGKPVGTTTQFDEEGKGALIEFVNIIGGSFLTALSNFMEFSLMPKIPNLMVGSGYEIKNNFKKLIYNEVQDVLSVKTELYINDEKIEGEIYLILDKDSFQKLCAQLSSKI